VPLNVDAGTLALSPALALDGHGNPVVVWSEAREVGDPFALFVKRLTGTRWEQLGTTPLNVDPAAVASSSAVALDRTGNPDVIWNEGRDAPSGQNIYLKHWTGQARERLSGALKPSHRELAYGFSLVLNEVGQPQVAWSEKNEADPALHLYLTVAGSRDGQLRLRRWPGLRVARAGAHQRDDGRPSHGDLQFQGPERARAGHGRLE
jgi:hypothetical protein